MENFKDYALIVTFIIAAAAVFCYLVKQMQYLLKEKGRRMGFPLYVIAVSLYGMAMTIPYVNNYFAMADIVNKLVK